MEAEGAQEARRNGAVVHRRAQSGQGWRWGGRGLGLRRMERRCAGVVDAAGVAGGEMGEDCLDDLGRVDARDRERANCISFGTVRVDAAVGEAMMWALQPVGIEAALAALSARPQRRSGNPAGAIGAG